MELCRVYPLFIDPVFISISITCSNPEQEEIQIRWEADARMAVLLYARK